MGSHDLLGSEGMGYIEDQVLTFSRVCKAVRMDEKSLDVAMSHCDGKI